MKTVKVVAAVIRRDGEVYATQRGYGEYKDGWEFPGGKVEEGETPEEALKREISEELDIEISVDSFLTTVEYDYPDFHLSMRCYYCHIMEGAPKLLEHEAARWLSRDRLDEVDWLPADEIAVRLIKGDMDGQLRLFHTGFEEIKEPDVRYGRKNADLGQGFYLSDDEEFSKRWARERRGMHTYLNTYLLNTDGLRIKRFSRDEQWFDYICKNRAGYEDCLSEYDVIIGPIANDTIYDTWGITTSGLLQRDQALRLLLIGPLYEQTVIKTEKAASRLEFVTSCILDSEEVSRYRDAVRAEEKDYQDRFAQLLSEMSQ